MSVFLGRICAVSLISCVALGGAAVEAAAPAAVDQIFYAPFLSKVPDGTTLTYSYVRKAAEKEKLAPSFEDEVKISVAPKGDAKSVTVDLFTGDREISNPNLSRSGNPAIIAIMQQDVEEMSKVLGGSPFYIKNRIMDAIKKNQSGQPVKVEYGGKTVDGWKYTLVPFAQDTHRAQLKDYAERTYELTFSDDVPGGLYALKTVTPRAGGGEPLLVEELTLKADNGSAAGDTEQKKQ